MKSLKELLDDESFRKFLNQIAPNICDPNINIIDEITHILNNQTFILEGGISTDHEYALLILQEAKWESEILNKKCAKLLYFFGSDLMVSQHLLSNLRIKIGNEYFFIQHDSKLSPPHVEIALQNFGFHIGNQYYEWEGKSHHLITSTLDFSNRFDISASKFENAEDLKLFTIENPSPGRFVSDPYLRKYGKDLYAAWVYNSCLNKNGNEEVLVCRIDKKIVGYQTLKYLSPTVGNLGILRIDSNYKGHLVGYAILTASIKRLLGKGCTTICTRTSKYNLSINRIKNSLGFNIIKSGIQFHWINNKDS